MLCGLVDTDCLLRAERLSTHQRKRKNYSCKNFPHHNNHLANSGFPDRPEESACPESYPDPARTVQRAACTHSAVSESRAVRAVPVSQAEQDSESAALLAVSADAEAESAALRPEMPELSELEAEISATALRESCPEFSRRALPSSATDGLPCLPGLLLTSLTA